MRKVYTKRSNFKAFAKTLLLSILIFGELSYVKAQPVAPSSFSTGTQTPGQITYSATGYTNTSYSGTFSLNFGRTSSSNVGANRLINSFTASGLSYYPVPSTSGLPFSRVQLKRKANPEVSDLGKQSLFFENNNIFTGSNRYFPVEYAPNMETAINSFIFNRGADNVFSNSNGATLNNVERIDLIIDEGVAATDVVKTGFLIMERGGNDPFRVAAITSLDVNGNPATYGPLLFSNTSVGSNWGGTGVNLTTTVFMKNTGDANMRPDQNISSQQVFGSYLSFQALGVPARTTVYGFSLFPGDVTTSTDLVNLTNTPLNSDATNTGGLDYMAGGGFFVAKDIPIAFSLSGNVYNDANGLNDNLVNGTGINNISGQQLYAYLVNSSNVIIDKFPVASDGSFVFNNTLDQYTDYTVEISSKNSNIGSSAPSGNPLPSGWVPVGESFGLNNQQGVGNETGIPNLKIPVRAEDASITAVNFGVSTSRLIISKKSDVLRSYLPGDTIKYTVVINNKDPFDHSGVNLTDNLPSGVSFVPGSLNVAVGSPTIAKNGTLTFNSSGTYNVPAAVDVITIEVWGAGGRGGTRTSSDNIGLGGGGGGAFSRSTINVTPSSSFNITVGQGSSNNSSPGGDSWFSQSNLSNALVVAKGGQSAPNNSYTGAIGGLSFQGKGDIRYSGGSGGSGGSGVSTGAGGGSSAGNNSSGTQGQSTVIGFSGGIAPSGGGNGGNGGNPSGNSSANGSAGAVPGGAGGGAKRGTTGTTFTGGNGANGRVVVSYNILGTNGSIGSLPNLATGWLIRSGDSLTATYKVVVNNPLTVDSIVNIASAISDFLTTPIKDTVTDYLVVKISGKVFNDANGNTIINGGESFTTLPVPMYVYLVDNNGIVSDSTQLANDGSYTLDALSSQTYTIELSIVKYSIGNNTNTSPINNTLPTGWVNTGENGTNNSGTGDGNPNGILLVQVEKRDVSNQNFGIERPPFADDKIYNVPNNVFIEGSQPGFPDLSTPGARYFSISTGNPSLTGYTNNGLLTGKDAEDCPQEQACNVSSTFKIDSIYTGTILFYNYGGETGLRQLGPNDVIPNYNPAQLVIYAIEGSGMSNQPVGFNYSMIDAANKSSQPASYTIMTESALPVELLFFKASINQCDVTLVWATASEMNNDFFEIQRSSNSYEWNTIGKVYGNGNCNTRIDYQFVDSDILSGINYYRLKQVDFDGTAEYHKIITVNGAKCFTATVKIFPVPAQNILNVNLNYGDLEKAQLIIVDVSGKSIRTITQIDANNQIDLRNMPSGSYFLLFNMNNNQVETYPFSIIK